MLAFNTTIVGQTIRLASRNKLLKYPDERELPAKFATQIQGQAPARPSSLDSERTAVGRHHALNGENEKGEDPNLVDWNGPDDPENPKNWSYAYKCWVTGLICLLTFSVYIGSSIYSQYVSRLRSRWKSATDLRTVPVPEVSPAKTPSWRSSTSAKPQRWSA